MFLSYGAGELVCGTRTQLSRETRELAHPPTISECAGATGKARPTMTSLVMFLAAFSVMQLSLPARTCLVEKGVLKTFVDGISAWPGGESSTLRARHNHTP